MRTNKKYFSIALVAIIMLTLAACTGVAKHDKEAAISSAQELIEITNTQDYDAVINMLPEHIQSQLSAKVLQEAWEPLLTSAGTFIEYDKATTTIVTQNGVDYIVVVVPCKYENNELTYTITYTTDLVVAALEME